MATLLYEHPLSKLVKQKNIGKLKKHKGPIHHLMERFKLDTRAIKKLPVAMHDPSKTSKLPFNTRITENKEDSAEEVRNTTEEIQIFSDGSALEGKVGASAVLTHKGRISRTLHFHLRPDMEHTVHEVELIGILLGIHLLKTEKGTGILVLIRVDNQAAIKAFNLELRSPGHYITREILQQANQLKKRGRKSKYALTIRWMVEHIGIEGNELADKEAKEAAKGHLLDTKLLPPYLRKTLLINLAALKMAHCMELKKKWKNGWNNSTRGKALAQIDETMPSTQFLKAISNPKLSRDIASKIAQLRLMHIPLNRYLKRIWRVDSARCPACRADEENITHYLLNCPSYVHERWALTQHARKECKAISVKILLEDLKFILPLAAYIQATGRFKQ